jgi:glycosyltransferase involved in cell wall biosynthesis
MTNKETEVSIVLPCLNEAETIAICINKILTVFSEQNIQGEVVICDNGSTDGSQKIATDLGASVVTVGERGYGAALQGGFAAARGKFLFMGDADDSYDFMELPKFIKPLREGAEFVIGCRLPSGGGNVLPGAMPFLHRWLGTPVLTFVSKLFFSTKIHDINCGMRGIRKEAYKRMKLKSPGMEFASEMVMKSALLQLDTVEVPITLHPDGRTREPHLRTWRDGWRHLRFMLLFSPKWLFVFPGVLLFVVGLLGNIALLGGPMALGDVIFSLNTHIVCAMATILGFQVIGLGAFANRYASAAGLLPENNSSQPILAKIGLDNLALGGAIAVLSGGAVLFWALFQWGDTDFGQLSITSIPHLVIPSVTIIVLGAQSIFTGFVLGLLELRTQAS